MKSTGDRFRDTVALTVTASGLDIPPFFIKGQVGNASKASGRRPSRGEKPVRGMNKDLMKRYIDHIASYVSESSLLLLDRASSHTSGEVLADIARWKTNDGHPLFKVLLLPPKTAFLLSPLDNGAISAFKKHFYNYDRSSFLLKQTAMKLAWDEVSNESLRNFAIQCGIDSSEPLSTIRSRFKKNVHGFIPEQLESSFDLYEAWIAKAIEVDGTQLHRGVELSPPMQLDEGALDGIKWITWGDHE